MYNIILGLVALVLICLIVFFVGPNVIFLVLAILLAILLWKRNSDLKENIYKMPEDALHITNVDKGGVFQLSGVGHNSDELTLKVLAKHLYQEGDFYWYELECDKGDGEKVWVEVEDDDDTKVSVVLEKLKLEDIKVSKSELKHIDDEESGFIHYKNAKYKYNESDEAIFYRFCDDKRPEKLYYWDFVNRNHSISVEKWGENEYLVYYCQIMSPSQVTVLSNNEKGENK